MSTLWTEDHATRAQRWAKPIFDVPLASRPFDADEQQARVAAVEDEARTRGFAIGRAAGFADGHAAAEGLGAQIKCVLDALCKPLAILDAEMERVLVALTLEAARRIAQQELHLDPAKVAAVVRDAVVSLGNGARSVAVFVNPDDYAALSDVLAGETSAAQGWRLVADPDVLPGGCRVESEQASVVASLDARAAGLAHSLLSSL